MKAKEISVQSLVVFFVAAAVVSAGLFVSRPHSAVNNGSLVFYGEETVVKQAARAVPVVQTATIPVPPQIVAPLPIMPPVVTFKVLPVYPASALSKGIAGTVLLSAFVGLDGQVQKLETKISSGIAELDNAASQAVSQWRFSPATQGGAALASWFEVPVKFVVQ